MYQNYLNYTALFFPFFKDLRCNTKENFLLEPEKKNVQNFTCVFTILVKFDLHFLGLPCEIFVGVITDN